MSTNTDRDLLSALSALQRSGLAALQEPSPCQDKAHRSPDADHAHETRKALLAYYNGARDKAAAFRVIFEAAFIQHEGWVRNAWTSEIVSRRGLKVTELDRAVGLLETELETTFTAQASLDRLIANTVHEFNPVKQELEANYSLDSSEWADGDRLASILFGVDDELSQVMLRKWLISAVARAVNPGCKADSALVLKGSQGVGKTTFFSELVGEYFLTLTNYPDDKEAARVFKRAWVVEYGEIETLTSRKHMATVKANMTKTHDEYRRHHKEEYSFVPRHVVFCGSTNDDRFLKDPTGNRRFWVIDIGDRPVNLEWLRENRSKLWAWVYSLYVSGETWHLDREQAAASEERAKSFSQENAYLDALEAALDLETAQLDHPLEGMALTKQTVFNLLNIDLEHQQRCSKLVAEAMKELGFSSSRRRANGKLTTCWVQDGFQTHMFYECPRSGGVLAMAKNPQD